jgi:hypothetical protein
LPHRDHLDAVPTPQPDGRSKAASTPRDRGMAPPTSPRASARRHRHRPLCHQGNRFQALGRLAAKWLKRRTRPSLSCDRQSGWRQRGWLYIRAIPSHAIELAGGLSGPQSRKDFCRPPNREAECGAQTGTGLDDSSVRRRCSQGLRAARVPTRHGRALRGADVANYLARVKAMEREFLRLAASQ